MKRKENRDAPLLGTHLSPRCQSKEFALPRALTPEPRGLVGVPSPSVDQWKKGGHAKRNLPAWSDLLSGQDLVRALLVGISDLVRLPLL